MRKTFFLKLLVVSMPLFVFVTGIHAEQGVVPGAPSRSALSNGVNDFVSSAELTPIEQFWFIAASKALRHAVGPELSRSAQQLALKELDHANNCLMSAVNNSERYNYLVLKMQEVVLSTPLLYSRYLEFKRSTSGIPLKAPDYRFCENRAVVGGF